MSYILESQCKDRVKTGFIYANEKDGMYTDNINKATKFRSINKAKEAQEIKFENEVIREYKNKKLR